MSHAVRSGDVVNKLIYNINALDKLDREIDDSLSPNGSLYFHKLTEEQITGNKERFAAAYKNISDGSDGDNLDQLFKNVDNLIQTAKSHIKNKVVERRGALQNLSECVTANIDKYAILYATTQEIKALSDSKGLSFFATIPEILQLQGRVTVLQGEVQSKPKDFVQSQKNAILELNIKVNGAYDSRVSRELKNLCSVLDGKILHRPIKNTDAATKYDQKTQIKEVLEELPLSVKGAIYGQVYHLSTGDRQSANWGEEHALDNLDILKRAVLNVIKKESPEVWLDIAKREADAPPAPTFDIVDHDEKRDTADSIVPVVRLTLTQTLMHKFGGDLHISKNGPQTEQMAQKHLKALDETTRNSIYTRVWEKAGKPQGIPDFGRDNVTKDLNRLEKIIQDIFIEGLPETYQREEMRNLFDFMAKQDAKLAAAVKSLD